MKLVTGDVFRVTFYSLLCIVLISCKRDSLELRISHDDSQESSDQKNLDGLDDESVSIPKNITGSYLACEVSGDADSQGSELQVGCRLADELSSQKTSITDILLDWDWTFRSELSELRVAVEPIEDDESPWHVIYRLDTSRYNVDTIKREVYVGLVNRNSGASLLRPIIDTTEKLNILLQGQWVLDECLPYAPTILADGSSRMIYTTNKIFVENDRHTDVVNFFIEEDCSGVPIAEERNVLSLELVGFDGYKFDIDVVVLAWTIQGNNDLGTEYAQRVFPCDDRIYANNQLNDITVCDSLYEMVIPHRIKYSSGGGIEQLYVGLWDFTLELPPPRPDRFDFEYPFRRLNKFMDVFPYCHSSRLDTNGNGWGEENGQVCRVFTGLTP